MNFETTENKVIVSRALNEDFKNELFFDKKLNETSNQLDFFAQIALKEFKEGKTIKKGFDEF